jgi:anti-sigma factor RsiW
MRCADARDAISARLDGEAGDAVELRALEEHLATCDACRAHERALEGLRRRLRVGTADVPVDRDPVPAIMAQVAALPAPVDLAARDRRAALRSRRWLSLAAACVALVVLAGVIALAGRGNDGPGVATRPAIEPATGTHLMLVWTSGGLPDGFAGQVRGVSGVRAVVEVHGDVLTLRARNGAVPVDTLAVDPARYAPLLDRDTARTVRALRDGDAVLGATGARLRGARVGDVLHFTGGVTLRVTGIVPDESIGGAEMLVRADDHARVTTPRFLLVEYDGERAETEALVQSLRAGTPMRFRAPGETPYLRHGDAVLPLAEVKTRFGEFAYRPQSGDRIAVDPAWVAQNIATRRIAGIGAVTCHRRVLDALQSALRALPDDALMTISSRHPDCYDPHMGPPGLGPSRHAWGIEITFGLPPTEKGGGGIDQRVVDAMEAHGFTWGGRWLMPEPGTFEWVGR